MRSHHSIPTSLLLSLAAATGTLTGGCAESPKAVSAVAGLPTYSPEEAALFGDTLGASAFGLPQDEPASAAARLDERAARADSIFAARISTVTERVLAGKTGYSISFSVAEPPLVGPVPNGPLELRLSESSASLARIRTAGNDIIGRRLIVFARHYEQGGEPIVHWHAEADDATSRKAAARAKRLDEPRARVQTP